MSSSMTELPKQVRKNRPLRSCLSCRKRKRKCDQAKPICSLCYQNNTDCEYQIQKWNIQVSQNLTPDINSVNNGSFIIETPNQGKETDPLIVKLIKERRFDIIDFNQTELPLLSRFEQNGVLNWCILTRIDLFINAVFALQNHRSVLVKNDVSNDRFFNKWEKENPELFSNSLIKRNKVVFRDDVEFRKCLDAFLDHNLFLTLVDIFFQSELSTHFPFLNHLEFLDQLSRLINGTQFNITKTKDLGIIGSLLIIMKLSESFVINTYGNDSIIDSNYLYIEEHKLNSITDILNKIQDELLNIRPCSIETFQFLLLRQYYQLYSLEESSCSNMPKTEQICILLNYANQLSLNRDPVIMLKLVIGDEKIALLRRLWFGVVLLDEFQFLALGTKKLISKDSYDTKLPLVCDSDGKTSKNVLIILLLAFHKGLSSILNSITSITNPPTLEYLHEQMCQIKLQLSKLELDSLIKQDKGKINNFIIFYKNTNLNLLLFMINFHLFIHYSRKQLKSYMIFYLIELIKSSSNLFRNISYLSSEKYSPNKLFGSGLLIFPLVENSLHKVSLLLMSTISRIKALKLTKNSTNTSNMLLIEDILSNVNDSLGHFYSMCIKYSSMYFHCWMLTKLHTAVFHKELIDQSYLKDHSRIAELLPIDKKMLDYLNHYSNFDGGFAIFDSVDLNILRNEFIKLSQASQLCCNDNDKINQSSQHTNDNINSADIEWNDKKWLDKILNDFSDQGILDPCFTLLFNPETE